MEGTWDPTRLGLNPDSDIQGGISVIRTSIFLIYKIRIKLPGGRPVFEFESGCNGTH